MTDAAVDAALGAESAAAAFEEDSSRQSAEGRGAAPLLRLSAFEGRLDWLLELARARKVDLARLSLVEVADQLIAALDTAAADEGRAGAAPLPRRGEWVVMGAALAELHATISSNASACWPQPTGSTVRPSSGATCSGAARPRSAHGGTAPPT